MHILNQALAYIQRYSIYLILVVIPIVLGFNIYPIQTIFPNLFPELEYVLFPYVYGKNIIFRILVELGLLAWFVRYLTKQAPGIQKPMQKLPLVAFCVLLLTLFVSNMLGSNPMFSLFSNFERMEGWFGLLHVLGFLFLIMVTFTTREMYHRGFWAALLGSICVLYAGFVEFIHRQEQAAALTASLPDVAFDMRVQSTLGNAAYVGIYAVFGVAFAALLLFAGARSRYQKFALWAIMLGHTVLLYTTATRSSWLGLCIGIAVFALVVLFKKYNPGNSLFSKNLYLHHLSQPALPLQFYSLYFLLLKIFQQYSHIQFLEDLRQYLPQRQHQSLDSLFGRRH